MSDKKSLSDRVLGSAPVVMFHLNVNGDGLIPSSAVRVEDNNGGAMLHTGRPGIKLCQGRTVDLEGLLEEGEKRGYIPKKFIAVRRLQGIMHRMVLVCVHKNAPDNGEAASFTSEQREDFLKLLRRLNWDTTVYRNFNDDGGNFIIMAGNPSQDEEELVLLVSEGEQFEMVDPRTASIDLSRTRGREALERIKA